MSGITDPKGFLSIESFRLEGMTPVWTYALADALLEKRVWMKHGENTTYVQYTMLRGTAPAEVALKALVNYRDYHGATHAGDWRMQIDVVDSGAGVKVTAFEGATPFFLKCADASCEVRHEWYRDCFRWRWRTSAGWTITKIICSRRVVSDDAEGGGERHVWRRRLGRLQLRLLSRRSERRRLIANGRF